MDESLLEFEDAFAAGQFLILQWWDFLIASLQMSTECKKTLTNPRTNLPALSEVIDAFCFINHHQGC